MLMIMILAKMIRFQGVGGKPGVALGELIPFGAHHFDLGENCMSLFFWTFCNGKIANVQYKDQIFLIIIGDLSKWINDPCSSGFWTIEKWKVKKNIFHFSREVQSEMKMPFTLFEKCKWKKWLEIEIKKWKWNENALRSRSEISREFKKDRFWSIGKGTLPSTNN